MTGTFPDRRLNAFRPDLADERLRDTVAADRYVAPQPARIAAGLVPVRPAPDPATAVDTYFTAGEPVGVFERRDGWAWCQSADDSYVGYLPEAALAPDMPASETAWIANPLAFVFAEPDLKTAILDTLPRHARVALKDTPPVETRRTFYRELQGGGFVAQAALSAAPPTSPDLLSAARLYLGAPYLWAGKSFAGIDCSGLVQRAFQDLGRPVPRDSDMQQAHFTEAGAATGIGDLAPGDLVPGDLIFGRGHVGIVTGPAVIHAEGTRHMRVIEQPMTDFFAEVFGNDWSRVAARRP